jgi:hypothetical protein
MDNRDNPERPQCKDRNPFEGTLCIGQQGDPYLNSCETTDTQLNSQVRRRPGCWNLNSAWKSEKENLG